jgi:hypothetical protein
VINKSKKDNLLIENPFNEFFKINAGIYLNTAHIKK